jgi:diguanylate cyclase (GGDEF)-like protein
LPTLEHRPPVAPPGSAGRAPVDAPIPGEWAAWWATPVPARLYTASLVVVALAVSLVAAVRPLRAGTVGAGLALAAAGMAVVELGRRAEGGRVQQQRIHKGLSAWPLAAALLLPAGLAGWVAAAVYAHARARGIRITRWKWIGSWGIVTLSSGAATAAFRAVAGEPLAPSGSGRVFAGVVVAIGVFLIAEAAGFLAISRFNRLDDERYLRAQLASPAFYAVEGAVLVSGALAAVLYAYWPGFLLLAGPVYLLLQRGMLHQPLRDEARHDGKTGVLNSEAWRATAASALGHTRRQEQLVAVIDIDHFKAVNDAFGHLSGDDVIARTAATIAGCVRSSDVVGRFGGDEFCALLFCVDADDARATAERIRLAIEALTFTDPDLAVTASVGLAAAPVAADLPELMAAADRALYRAKRAGRNRVETAEPRTGMAPVPTS